MSVLKSLLNGDLGQRSTILRRQEEVQAQCAYAKKAAEVFADCLTATSAIKDAFAASILSTKALEQALKNALNLYGNHHDILATISSTKGMLLTWAEIVARTEALLTHLDKATDQVEIHLYQAADEHAAHESGHVAASESVLYYTDSLHGLDRSIAHKRSAIFGIRHVPTEILLRIFIEAVDARQHEIITSLSSYYDVGGSFQDPDVLLTTFNFVPFTLSATCRRWRVICLSTPQLWRYTRAPMITSTYYRNMIIGRTQLERCVLLAQNQPLDLTVYPCYNLTHQSATYYDLEPLAESRVLRVNIVWHSNYGILRGIPSPTELCMVASANSPTPYAQDLPTELLANTKTLRCRGLTPQIGSAVGIQTLHISLSKQEEAPEFDNLLRNCPQLEELHLEITTHLNSLASIFPFIHEQLHTIFFTGMALPWVVAAISVGCRLPRLTRLVLTDLDAVYSGTNMQTTSFIYGQISRITHIEVQAVSEPKVVCNFSPLFESATALGTLTLSGSAVEPVLVLLTHSAPKRVNELLLCNSIADGTALREYLAAIKEDGGGNSGIKVTWDNCPNFSGEYGGAFGELHL